MEESVKLKSFSYDVEGLGDKFRQRFSRSPARINTVSVAKTKKNENENENKKKKRWSIHKAEKESKKSNNPKTKSNSLTNTADVSPDFTQLTSMNSLDHNNGVSRTNDSDYTNNFHYFVHHTFTHKCKCCEFCKKDLISSEKLVTCTYCRRIYHEECCKKVKEKCNNNQLLMLNDIVELNQLNIASDFNSKISDYPKISYDFKETDVPDFSDKSHNSYNFYQDDSLVNTKSSLSLPLSLHQSYDFTTLDRDSIKAYGIAVNPIFEGNPSLFENKSYDSSSKKIEIVDNKSFCKSSYVYNESKQEIITIQWSIQSLKTKSTWFNKNDFGLNSELKSFKNETYVLGTVRIYINLLRPIKMELSSRPKSIYDVVGSAKELHNFDCKVETIWLPRGSSKRLYVHQSTSTIEVINCLLNKFHIKVDPKIFGLYEHTIEGERKVTVRKLANIECPLALLLSWSSEDVDKFNKIMSVKRLVLQENETGDIEWSEFSTPELRNFLLILKREEEEIAKQITLKYSVLTNEVIRLRDLVLKTTSFITVL